MSRDQGAGDGDPSVTGRDCSLFGPRASRRRDGIAVALRALVRAMPSLVALPILQACLVTQHVQLDPPENFPPSVLDPLSPPLGYRPIGSHIDLSSIEGGDAGTPTTIPFEVAVRDPDVDQELLYLVWVNYPATTEPARRGELPPDPAMDPDRRVRTLRFNVDASLVPCSRVELRVATNFQFLDPREPVIEGDIATATWWIVEDRTVPISLCPEAP